MHKSTALIIITIILYFSFKINIRFLRERSRGPVLTINEKKSFGINPKT